jgi:Arc/MetJ-type ribon-helix-helix transcriptional regulator
MIQNRINTRLPDQLAEYVAEVCGNQGFYETASEFVRDLIREHYEKAQTQKWQNLLAKLAPGANAGIEEFHQIDPAEQLASFKERYRKEH